MNVNGKQDSVGERLKKRWASELVSVLAAMGVRCYKYRYHGEHTSPSNSGELAHLISSTLSTTIFCHTGHYIFIILSVFPPRNLAFH